MDEYKRSNNRDRQERHGRLCRFIPLFVLVCGIDLVILAFLPAGLASQLIPVAQAHAVLLRSDPAANALLRVPPPRVRLWFDDDLVPATSRAIVDDAAGHEVDHRDSQVSRSNPREMTVTLPRLPGETYTVLWVAQSTDDAHVTQGSFSFRVVGPHGTVPPAAGQQASSGTNVLASARLDGPIIVQVLTTWLALLGMACWLGGLIWETWILPPGMPRAPDLRVLAQAAARRFRQLLPYVLSTVLLANIGVVLAQEAELAGSWSGAFTPSLLQAVLFGSRFGFFWWLREGVVVAALGQMLVVSRRGSSSWRTAPQPTEVAELVPAPSPAPPATPDWWHAVLEAMRRVPHLPARLVSGWRGCSWPGRIELLLAAALLVAFAFSGHAASVANAELGYAVSVDVLHVLGMAAWVGGLLYISSVLMPTLRRLNLRQYAQMLAQGVPEFSALALTSAIVLAATGSLNTSLHLASLQQFLTTLYGWVLAVKIEFFLLMAALSAYHAFYLRPRLVQALTRRKEEGVGTTKQARLPASTRATARPERHEAPASEKTEVQGDDEGISEQAQRLAERMEDWLRREALLGALVLLCVALLGVFAGTLGT